MFCGSKSGTGSNISKIPFSDIRQETKHQAPQSFLILDLSSHTQGQNATAETGTREAAIIDIDGIPHYVKNINYGNQRAAEEVLMAKYMALTGLPTPETSLGTHCENLLNHADRRDISRMAECDLACVVSKMEPTFKDLGKFLLEDGLKKIKEESQVLQYQTHLEIYANACQEEKSLLPPETQKTNDTLVQARLRALIQAQPAESALTNEDKQLLKPLRQAKRQQLRALHEMYHLLPDTLQKEMELAFYASEFIGNNDFLNFSLYNTGFVKRNGALRAMVIDYGNCGPSGFKGRYIEDSLDIARQRARIQDPVAANILIQKIDLQFSASKVNRLRAQSTNDLPQSSHAPSPEKLRSQSADSADNLLFIRKSITGLGGMPRNRPVAGLLKSNIQAETAWVMDGVGGSPSKVPKELDSAIEMAYRLAQIPEPILLEVAKQHWLVGNDDRFPFFDPYHASNLSAENIANIMGARLDTYINKFTPDQINHWIERHPDRAHLARNEVAQAVDTFRRGALSQTSVPMVAA